MAASFSIVQKSLDVHGFVVGIIGLTNLICFVYSPIEYRICLNCCELPVSTLF